MFSSFALELLAGKVASTCGDVRRALDIGRRVIELTEVQKSNQTMPLQPTTDHGMYMGVDVLMVHYAMFRL
jgi:cell division control protein 6